MIIWLNGPFGVGKTTVARLLVGHMAGVHIFNPEHVGYVLRRTFWRGQDYQDVATWRLITRLLTRSWARRGHVIVPMTVVDRNVFADITRGARVFALVASEETILARIAGADKSRRWRTENLGRCLAAFDFDAFGERIVTDGRTPLEVTREILDRL